MQVDSHANLNKQKKTRKKKTSVLIGAKKYSTDYKASVFPSVLILYLELLGQNPALSLLLPDSQTLGTHLFVVLRACEHLTVPD